MSKPLMSKPLMLKPPMSKPPMSLFSMLRRPSYSALSYAVRAVGSAKTFHREISTVPTFAPSLIRRSFVPTPRFCTTAAVEPIGDQGLIGFLESAIESVEEDYLYLPIPDIPDEFPFEVVDNPDDNSILLKREFEGETIQMCVDIPKFSVGDNTWDEIPIVVNISKPNGQQLEFGMTGYECFLIIDTLYIKHPLFCSKDEYEVPKFKDFDRDFQFAFDKYLDDRGIEDSIMEFLFFYMENKHNREWKMWLKNLKSFIEL